MRFRNARNVRCEVAYVVDADLNDAGESHTSLNAQSFPLSVASFVCQVKGKMKKGF